MVDRRYTVKQRLGQITTEAGLEMVVYSTGAASWYLFCPLIEISPGTFVQGDLAFPYRGKDLKRGWRKRLH